MKLAATIAALATLTVFALMFMSSSKDTEIARMRTECDSISTALQFRISELEINNDALKQVLARKAVNLDSLKTLLKKSGIKYPDLFAKIAIVESGWNLSSTLARNHNNFFGMKWSNHKLVSYPVSTSDGVYAGFASPADCVAFMVYWQGLEMPHKGERDINWLRRRGYNPRAEYYEYLELIRL